MTPLNRAIVWLGAIGLVTAAFLPDRHTVQGITAISTGAQKLLGTAITGKA